MELVIFDCDGVLVDSEALVLDVESEMLTAAGYPLTADEIAERFTGLSYASMLGEIARDFGKPMPRGLSEEMQRAAMALFPEKLTPVPGIPDLLAALERPRCVASSSDLERIHLSLRVCGLERHFAGGSVFSAEMVRNGKPAPDLFLLAAETMRAAPGACVVIEDSPPGVEAARAAGMTAFGLLAGGHTRPGLEERLREAGAARVFETTAELQAHLASLG